MSNIITRATRFIDSNRQDLEDSLANLDAEILRLQETRAKLHTFLKAFPESTDKKVKERLNFGPQSVEAIKIGKILYGNPEFTADDFYQLARKERPTFEKSYVYNILKYWREKSWLENLGHGRYKIKEALILANEN